MILKFEKTEVFNFKNAIRGMRNPLNSWNKSDSKACYEMDCYECEFNYEDKDEGGVGDECAKHDYIIGKNDLKLAQTLIEAGNEHRKFLRQIFVSVDITAPLYWFKEFDTYKIGTVSNSTSTMHKLATTPITLDCFETDDYEEVICDEEGSFRWEFKTFQEDIINTLEMMRLDFLKTKDIRIWKEMVRWLPESWLQTRTVTMNYEVLRNMYFQRKNHKLTEWSKSFIEWVDTLPYSKELIEHSCKEDK